MSYKLYYFDGRGRAELSRYIFELAGVKYEDIRLNKDTWPAFKPKTTAGQLPVLEVKGQLFSQSIPIAIYLASQFGLYGSNAVEQLAIMEVISIAGDLRDIMINIFFKEKDEARKAELMKKLKEEDLPKFLGIFEKLLSKDSSDFFVTQKISLADLVVFDVLSNVVDSNPNAMDTLKKIKANYDKVANNPKIKAWIAKRPKTSF